MRDLLTFEFGFSIGNLFNHPNFANPASNISIPSGGQVLSDVGALNVESASARRMEGRLRIKW